MTRGSAISPGKAVSRPVVDDGFATWRSKRCGIKVEITMDKRVCRELRLKLGATLDVES